ncbi:MAG: RICIN domain-containing protein [Agriterribacter sp.]
MNKMRLYFIMLSALCGWLPVCSQTIKGTFAITNVQTGIVLRIKDANTKNGTPIVAYSPVNWKCVTWNFTQAEGQSYTLTNLYSGKTLQPAATQPTAGGTLEEQPLGKTQQNQLYEFIPVEKEHYMIKLKDTDLYITAPDEKGTINAGIILAKRNNTRLQYWSLHEQKPEI